MKVIFLDVDGVLNCIGWFEKNRGGRPGSYEIDPEKVKLLKEIIDRTGAKVVLSSTWRNIRECLEEPANSMYAYLVGMLRKYDIEIFSYTPLINNDRPKEIKAWIDSSEFEIENYVSLDDDFGEKDYQRQGISGHLIRTLYWDKDGGLTREHVEKAVRLLNK